MAPALYRQLCASVPFDFLFSREMISQCYHFFPQLAPGRVYSGMMNLFVPQDPGGPPVTVAGTVHIALVGVLSLGTMLAAFVPASGSDRCLACGPTGATRWPAWR